MILRPEGAHRRSGPMRGQKCRNAEPALLACRRRVNCTFCMLHTPRAANLGGLQTANTLAEGLANGRPVEPSGSVLCWRCPLDLIVGSAPIPIY